MPETGDATPTTSTTQQQADAGSDKTAEAPRDAGQASEADGGKSETGEGKGGKDALLADLAGERDKRQAAETKLAEAETERNSQLDAIAKALGLKPEEKPDPEKLAASLSAAQDETRQARVENAVLKAASRHGVSPDALTDSRSFMAKVADLDPADEKFIGKVDEAIKAAVEANPNLSVEAGQSRPSRPVSAQGNGGAAAAPGSGDWLRDQLTNR